MHIFKRIILGVDGVLRRSEPKIILFMLMVIVTLIALGIYNPMSAMIIIMFILCIAAGFVVVIAVTTATLTAYDGIVQWAKTKEPNHHD